MEKFIKAMIVTMLGIFTTPLIVKPAPAVVGASMAAYATQLPAEQPSPPAQPAPQPDPIPEPKPEPKPEPAPQPQPKPEPKPAKLPGRCCPECTCEVCTCEYPGQCLLKAAGKHILWIHDPVTKAWRGYASPHCKDVREIDPHYQFPTYNVMNQLVPKSNQRMRVRSGGGCANGQCGVR